MAEFRSSPAGVASGDDGYVSAENAGVHVEITWSRRRTSPETGRSLWECSPRRVSNVLLTSS